MAIQAKTSFTSGNLFRHVSVMAFTSSIGLMAIFAVDLIDIIFISMLGQESLAAAAGYASTLMFFASAVNIGLSIAAGALVAKAIGADNEVDAREYATSVAVISVIVGILIPIITLPNIDFLLSLVGATGQVAEMAASYLWIILPTTLLSGMAMTAVAVLRAYGDANRAMYPSLAGAAVNAVFDPILIFTLGFGLEGAALATVLARFVTMLVALYPAIARYRAFAIPRPRCVMRDFGDAAKIAIPAVLGTVATPVGAAIVTREMAQFGSDAVAGMAVINRMVPVVFAVVLALSGAIGPIFGQNHGAGQHKRVREAFFDGLIFVAVYVLVMSALLFLLREPIADLFDATGMMRSLIFIYCGPLALAAFFNGAIFVSNASFNNLGHPMYSTWINWGRSTLGTLPLVILGASIWGAHGVLIGQAIGGIIFAGIAVSLSMRMIDDPNRSPLKPKFLCPDERMQIMSNRCCRS
ncbi:Multidrug export protein MepA [Roseovarius litorisediminis]|uniref:Multidrug export protein MepA n=1 Tax=Roseovarius litorisediminis TaxID=1312363 RepID=A0A1Y5R9T8_9RHOB|nr:MATE family efflux transporter [Roseovarius litorisediminis]SLN12395.1 Multidrug export protein MepA [Roseovarius litorisediminis]